jgi:methionine synthase II (cobalamin-independent)
VQSAEKLLLSGRRNREADLESAVLFFFEFLRGFESFNFQEPCVTVFGSARFEEAVRIIKEVSREVPR